MTRPAHYTSRTLCMIEIPGIVFSWPAPSLPGCALANVIRFGPASFHGVPRESDCWLIPVLPRWGSWFFVCKPQSVFCQITLSVSGSFWAPGLDGEWGWCCCAAPGRTSVWERKKVSFLSEDTVIKISVPSRGFFLQIWVRRDQCQSCGACGIDCCNARFAAVLKAGTPVPLDLLNAS